MSLDHNRRFVSYRSKHFVSPLIGIVFGERGPSKAQFRIGGHSNNVTVAPCLAGTGTIVQNLYDLIEDWDTVANTIRPGEPRERIEEVQVLAPLVGRDILAVAKNYRDHVKEMRSVQPGSEARGATPAGPPSTPAAAAEIELPMMFTKRATSIIPNGGKIYLHPNATQSVDYEGELGIIIGKAGYSIKKEDAFKHVWGATILNDISARDRQKQHKQFYVGKSFDTFCPIGPYAIHASQIDWNNLMLETRVNGEVRQKQNTSEVIFDIPTLMENCSAGITLQPGDIIATGTPAGVAAGRNPPAWLKHGDVVEVSITGLGTLRNVCESRASPPTCEPIRTRSSILAPPPHLLALPNGKYLNVNISNPSVSKSPTALFIHGLGGSVANFEPLIEVSAVKTTHRVITFDLEGFGKSPISSPSAELSVEAYAEDVKELLEVVKVTEPIPIVAHSLGGFIACHFAARYPERVKNLFLLGPAGPSTQPVAQILTRRAEDVRAEGMSAVATRLTIAGLSEKTKRTQPLVVATVRASTAAADPEAYSRACLALASATTPPDYGRINGGHSSTIKGTLKPPVKTLIVLGAEEKLAPRAIGADVIVAGVAGARLHVLDDVGHWPHMEALEVTSRLLREFLYDGEDLLTPARL